MFYTNLLACAQYPTSNSEILIPSTSTDHTLQCDVVFGAPSADCGGTGICKITGTNSFTIFNKSKACNISKGIVSKTPDNKGLSLFFFRAQVCTKLYRQHFQKGVLKMEEPCMLPDSVCDALGLSFNKILPGNYPILEGPGFFRFEVDCA